MAQKISPEKLMAHYPPSLVDSDSRTRDFNALWPEMEKLYDGENIDLFKSFSIIIFESYSDTVIQSMTPAMHYTKMKQYFDFFMTDLEVTSVDSLQLPGMLIGVEQPKKEMLNNSSTKMAYTEILIHTVDSPFIFENLNGYINLSRHQLITAILRVVTIKRENGKIKEILRQDEEGPKEVFIKFRISKIVNPNTIKTLKDELQATLKSLFLAVADFDNMVKSCTSIKDDLSNDKHDVNDAKETAEFIQWLVPANFIFMGMGCFELTIDKKSHRLAEIEEKRFGVFRDHHIMNAVYPGILEELKQKITKSEDRPYMMVLDFLSNSPRIIYHSEPVDAILIRQYNENKSRMTVSILLGRFSRGGLMTKSTDIPLLRKKLTRVLETEKVRPKSHLHRELYSFFQQLPKKELFYIDRESLGLLMSVATRLRSENEIHMILRQSRDYGYFVTTLVFSSKKYSVRNIKKVGEYLSALFNQKILYRLTSQSDIVSSLYFYFSLGSNGVPQIDLKNAIAELSDLITSWEDLLLHRLVERFGDPDAFKLYNKFIARLPEIYKQAVKPLEAVNDLYLLKELEKTETLQMDITMNSKTSAILRLFWNKELNLMKLIPTFSNLGINVKEEIAIPLVATEENRLYAQLLMIEDSEEEIKKIISLKPELIETIQHVIAKKVEDCPLNKLVLSAGLSWMQVDIVRAYQNFILQINPLVNPHSVTQVIVKYSHITKLAVNYFEERFDLKKGDISKLERLKGQYMGELEKVTDLSEDSILRLLLNVMENTTRTNFFKPKEEHFISMKIKSSGISIMPKPVPMAEIYVHTPFVEGVHLRGGKVARGGLRWSDRPDDFRTEVLGLMKTQMVKNAIIVPSGSKGGFVIKKFKFETREEKEIVFKKHYQTFIRGLLDLTDNIVEGKTVPPDHVKCHDAEDPYLVVAADKGTAMMSDAANEVSENFSFWLKDAFASGGSIGYDHKKFGITAKGAWECIKRHFRELGTDIQNESITVVGIGSMDGDVFGNGMLLSKKIKLVAAFSHIHIFIDPNPDPETSYKERQRLFETPRTTWGDYDRSKISKGGGVYDRTAKSIPISDEMKEKLGTSKNQMSGLELIRTILTMPVDLIYSGGIGTYFRATTESSSDVGDKANDSVRINAQKIRARVIGEGANLSLTQKARIEYAENGGILNTDSVDNSAGVDMSDHEVNLKILLEQLLEKGDLKDRIERDALFTKLGPEVAEMVLQDNYLQSHGISLDKKRSEKKFDLFCEYIDKTSSEGLIDREDEKIPDTDVLRGYPKKPGYMPRPVLSVLFGYEKIRIKKLIIESPIVDTAFAARYLFGYFPAQIRHDYEPHIAQHRLRKEIIATMICNRIVNQAGITFLHNLEETTNAKPWEILRAYLIAENLLEADIYRKQVHELDNKVEASLQMELHLDMEDLIAKTVSWMLKHMAYDRVNFDFIGQYKDVINKFRDNLFIKLESICSLEEGCIDKKVQELSARNIPADLAKTIVILPYMKDIISIISIKEERHADFIETGNLFILATSHLQLDWLYEAIENYRAETVWEKKTVENLARELESYQGALVLKILEFKRKDETMEKAFSNYIMEREKQVANYRTTLTKIQSETPGNLLAIAVLVRQLSDML
ncbi:MAG: NAD-glutamate dehydrogenase [Nitrospinota bacterium]|nr:NAD-glutamate dehydrogenase [Nitrospinota bacterium]